MLRGEDLKAFFRTFAGHRTARCLLRPLEPADLEPYYQCHRDPAMTRFEVHEPFGARAEAEALFTRWIERRSQGGSSPFSVILEGEDRWVGMGNFGEVSPEYDYVAVGFSIAATDWGRGLATEVLKGLLTIAFERIGCYRVEGNCATEHHASARVMEKAGMTREGVLRGKLPVGAVHHDLQYFSMLRPEYRAARRE